MKYKLDLSIRERKLSRCGTAVAVVFSVYQIVLAGAAPLTGKVVSPVRPTIACGETDSTFDNVIARAQKKAKNAFRRPKRIANADFDFGNPPEARGLVYAEALRVVPKRSTLENEGTGFSAYPRRGTAWEKCRIFYQKEAQGEYTEHKYWSSLIDYDAPEIKPPLPKRIPKSVSHWTELGVFTSLNDGFPQLINMRANGYMRIASGNTIYGHSERAFVEQESLDTDPKKRTVREKFPLMTEVFFSFPNFQHCTVYQIYENESAVMARRLQITMGEQTVINVKGVLIPRRGEKLRARQNIGMAHISMYWKGARENAEAGEHAHDSDTVGVTYADGTTRDFTIPRSPERTDDSQLLFVDLENGKDISGYSLEQRDREESNYIPGVDYHLRSSMRITDLQWSVPISTQLILLPHDGEFFDNVVLRTVIRPDASAEDPIQFSYVETVGQF